MVTASASLQFHLLSRCLLLFPTSVGVDIVHLLASEHEIQAQWFSTAVVLLLGQPYHKAPCKFQMFQRLRCSGRPSFFQKHHGNDPSGSYSNSSSGRLSQSMVQPRGHSRKMIQDLYRSPRGEKAEFWTILFRARHPGMGQALFNRQPLGSVLLDIGRSVKKNVMCPNKTNLRSISLQSQLHDWK